MVTNRERSNSFDRLNMSVSKSTIIKEDLREKKRWREKSEQEIFILGEKKKECKGKSKNNSVLCGLMGAFFQLLKSNGKEDANNRTI
jgi:hypothetical protein